MTSYLKNELRNGNKRFDIGVMQISWLYQGNRFKSLSDAIDPITNLEAGADYLKYLLEKTGSIRKAVGMYHTGEGGSVTDQNEYVQLVEKELIKIHKGNI